MMADLAVSDFLFKLNKLVVDSRIEDVVAEGDKFIIRLDCNVNLIVEDINVVDDSG